MHKQWLFYKLLTFQIVGGLAIGIVIVIVIVIGITFWCVKRKKVSKCDFLVLAW